VTHVLNMNFYPYNGKIADINEADTADHTVDISAYVPQNCVAVILKAYRVSGTGYLLVYPNEGTIGVWLDIGGTGAEHVPIIAIKNQRLKYKQSVAGDDFDLFMFGYFVEGRVM